MVAEFLATPPTEIEALRAEVAQLRADRDYFRARAHAGWRVHAVLQARLTRAWTEGSRWLRYGQAEVHALRAALRRARDLALDPAAPPEQARRDVATLCQYVLSEGLFEGNGAPK